MKKTIITVVGNDTVGIIAKVCTYLAENQVNILDISQTIVQGYFNMMMIADTAKCEKDGGELAKELETRVSEVFNRGFWDGYYQGAKLGQWSDVYGNKATKKKTYVGKVTNFFSNLSVAEVLIETGELRTGDEVLIIGPSTGVMEHKIEEIRTNLESVEIAVKGEYCSLPLPAGVKLRRSDKIYLWR